jgi:hypothetical protein
VSRYLQDVAGLTRTDATWPTIQQPVALNVAYLTPTMQQALSNSP